MRRPAGETQHDSRSEAQRPSSVLSVLWEILRRRKVDAVLLVAGAFAAGLAESALLALVAHAATAMVDGTTEVAVSLGPMSVVGGIAEILAVAGALGVVRLALQLGLSYLPARLAADLQAELRTSLFDAYVDASWETQSRERDGHLQELLTSQVVQASQALQQATTLVSSGMTFLTLALAAFLVGPGAAVAVFAVVVLMALILRPVGSWGRSQSIRLSAAQVDYAGAVGSAFRLAEETFSFGVQDAERGRVHERVVSARRHYLLTQFAQRLTQGLYQSLVILLLVIGLFGLHQFGTGQIASLGTVVLILLRAASYGQRAQVAWQIIQQTSTFLDRVIAATERFVASPPVSGRDPFPADRRLVFDRVSFAYRPDEPVLRDVSFDIEAGATIGVLGPSGAGKSTLVQLLLRMRLPTSGTITIGETPIDAVDLREWRRHVAYVPQESRLLDATVADNIRFGRDLDHNTIVRAARLANIHDAILEMAHGYETVIGQRVDAVSGGQRQRICLARALAGQPDILLLDEPTSSLDAASEQAIRDSLVGLRGGPTIIIVAHRPALLQICERTLEVRGGSVADITGDTSRTLTTDHSSDTERS